MPETRVTLASDVASDLSYSTGRAVVEAYPTVALTDAQLANFSCGGFDTAIIAGSRMMMTMP